MTLPDWLRHSLLALELAVGGLLGFAAGMWGLFTAGYTTNNLTELDAMTMGMMFLFSGALFLHVWRRTLPARMFAGLVFLVIVALSPLHAGDGSYYSSNNYPFLIIMTGPAALAAAIQGHRISSRA